MSETVTSDQIRDALEILDSTYAGPLGITEPTKEFQEMLEVLCARGLCSKITVWSITKKGEELLHKMQMYQDGSGFVDIIDWENYVVATGVGDTLPLAICDVIIELEGANKNV